jgi:hypothetical protein
MTPPPITLYVDGVAVGSSYVAFASTATTNQAELHTAQVTYKGTENETESAERCTESGRKPTSP